MTTYYVTVVCRGSSEGQEFTDLDKALDYVAQLARFYLLCDHPEDFSIEFGKEDVQWKS